MEFTLRDFRPEDFDQLWQVDQDCFVPGIAYSRQELAAYIHRRGSFTLVAEAAVAKSARSHGNTALEAESEHDILGFIVAEANRRIGHILTIDVPLASRRFGIGSKLLTAAEDRFRAVPCTGVVLETAVDNAAALAFYKRHGYDVVKTSPRYYSNGLDAFVLEKDLSSGPRTNRVRSNPTWEF